MTQFGIWLVSLVRFGGTYHAAGQQRIGALYQSKIEQAPDDVPGYSPRLRSLARIGSLDRMTTE